MTNKAKEYVNHIAEISKAHGMDYDYRLRGGLSDANILAECGVICIDGMGPSGDYCHSVLECLDIDSIIPAFEYSNIIISDLAERKIK